MCHIEKGMRASSCFDESLLVLLLIPPHILILFPPFLRYFHQTLSTTRSFFPLKHFDEYARLLCRIMLFFTFVNLFIFSFNIFFLSLSWKTTGKSIGAYVRNKRETIAIKTRRSCWYAIDTFCHWITYFWAMSILYFPRTGCLGNRDEIFTNKRNARFLIEHFSRISSCVRLAFRSFGSITRASHKFLLLNCRIRDFDKFRDRISSQLYTWRNVFGSKRSNAHTLHTIFRTLCISGQKKIE